MKNIPYLVALVVLGSALSGCTYGIPEPLPNIAPPPNLLSQDEIGTVKTVRVIVQFHQPIAIADTALLTKLQQQAHARVVYLAAVSPDTHVYSVEVVPGQAVDTTLQRLAALPSVKRVELDSQVKAH